MRHPQNQEACKQAKFTNGIGSQHVESQENKLSARRKKLQEKKKCLRRRKGAGKGTSVTKVVDDLKAFIGGMSEAPDHLVDNEFIRRGYRIGYNKSIKSIMKSLFQFHNESVNVWSHLFGMIFFGTIMILYTLNSITSWKEVSSFVWSGLLEARSENQHVVSYF